MLVVAITTFSVVVCHCARPCYWEYGFLLPVLRGNPARQVDAGLEGSCLRRRKAGILRRNSRHDDSQRESESVLRESLSSIEAYLILWAPDPTFSIAQHHSDTAKINTRQ